MIDNKPIVAIQCATYNHEPYIRDCLEGFVMQETNFPFVAIVHDDASTDGTAAIVKEYAEKYPDIIKPIYETENQYSKPGKPLQKIMNDAITKTGAKYIALCEGDDYWTDPLKLQKQVDFMEANPDVGLLYTDYNEYNEHSRTFKYDMFKSNKKYMPQSFSDHLLRKCYIAPMSWLFRNDVYQKQCDIESPAHFLDGSFVMALKFFLSSKVAFMTDTTAVYRVHEGSATNSGSIKSRYDYHKSVFETQLFFAHKYCPESFVQKIKESFFTNEYCSILITKDKENYRNLSTYFKRQDNDNIVKYLIIKLLLKNRLGRQILRQLYLNRINVI